MSDRYAVIGHPIAHSQSPFIHAAFARQTGQDICYEAILAPLDGFAAAVHAFRQAGGKGMNVTLPFKLDALALADSASERARRAGAANTLRFEGAQIFADNTDGIGLVRDLRQRLALPLTGQRILILGAGGAARGVIEPLLAARPALLAIANRSVEKAHALRTAFAELAESTALASGGFADFAGAAFDLVINATSASLGGSELALPAGVFAEGALAYDMAYGLGETPFLKSACALGAARFADGLGMLVEQAAESFYLWRGVRPTTAPVLAQLRERLAQREKA